MPEQRVRVLARAAAFTLAGQVVGPLLGLALVVGILMVSHRWLTDAPAGGATLLALLSATIGGLVAGVLVVCGRRLGAHAIRKVLLAADAGRPRYHLPGVSVGDSPAAVPSLSEERSAPATPPDSA